MQQKNRIRNKRWIDLRLSSVDMTWRAWVFLPASFVGLVDDNKANAFDYPLSVCIAADWDKQRCMQDAREELKTRGWE